MMYNNNIGCNFNDNFKTQNKTNNDSLCSYDDESQNSAIYTNSLCSYDDYDPQKVIYKDSLCSYYSYDNESQETNKIFENNFAFGNTYDSHEDKKQKLISDDNYLYQKEKEGKNMSIAYVQILKDKIIMLADSRSTKFIDGKPAYDDNFDKIYYSERFKIGLVSTGLNTFDDLPFVELAKKIEKNSTSLLDFFNKLNDQILYYTKLYATDVQIIYAHYVDTKNYLSESNFALPEIISQNINAKLGLQRDASSAIGHIMFSGVSWCCDFFKNAKLDTTGEQKPEIILKSKIQAMIDLNTINVKESPIGGEVKLLILHPDGTVEWV